MHVMSCVYNDNSHCCHTFAGVVIANQLQGFPNDLLVVDVSMRGDLTSKQDHSCLSHGLCEEIT